MIDLTAEQIAAAMGGEIDRRGQPGEPVAASIDSRELQPGALFFGLRGGSEDGGRYAGAALEDGAWGAVVTPDVAAGLSRRPGWVFSCPDPLASLQSLARAWRRRLGSTVIGITGSVGKTTVKDITRAILPGSVHASDENRNTEIGLPLTILEAPAGTGTLVLEMAMRGPGQIAELAGIAEPDVGVITNAGPVHVELLGSVAAVAAAKAELIAGLPDAGVVVAPVDAGPLEPHLAGRSPILRFGPGGDVEAVTTGAVDGGTEVEVRTPAGTERFSLPFAEAHNVTNALAAIAAGHAAGAGLAEMAARSGTIEFSKLRGEHLRLGDDILVINDCYNANPISMRAALDYLGGLDRPRRIAVLGGMGELGDGEVGYHREVGEHGRELGLDLIVGVGEMARHYRPDELVGDPLEAAELLASLARPGDAVLVKASRAGGLEAVAEALGELLPVAEA